METIRKVYDAFNRLWAKVPRHVRVDRENQALMHEVRAYFDALIEAAKQTEIVDLALAAAKTPATDASPEDANANLMHVALRILRTLSRKEWEMVKAIVDLHKFAPGDILDILDELQDAHCPRCGEWLDDEDDHANCPVPPGPDSDAPSVPPSPADPVDGDATQVAVAVATPAPAPEPVVPAAERQLKIVPQE